MLSQDILVTTTSNLEGWKVIKYINLVSARVVTGTDFISDFFASFSDIFGGRSSAYQEELRKINEEVIGFIKEEAYSLGANAVIGLRIDFDEISGKGMQMFMVTATGTAVLAENEEMKSEDQTNSYTLRITDKQLQEELEKREVIDNIKSNGWEAAESKSWSFITKHKVDEASKYIIENLGKQYDDYYCRVNIDVVKYAAGYYLSINPDIAINDLYGEIIKNGSGSAYCVSIIKAAKLIDYNYINKILDENNVDIKKNALNILICGKTYYSKDDIPVLKGIVDKIKNGFPDTGNAIDERNRWMCQCGKLNRNTDKYCVSCNKDIKGLYPADTVPDEAVLFLNKNIEVLDEMFNSKNK